MTEYVLQYETRKLTHVRKFGPWEYWADCPEEMTKEESIRACEDYNIEAAGSAEMRVVEKRVVWQGGKS